MSLRVLLADESSTIKKVIQLALQDLGVEVKSVPVGIDVLPVALSYHPDIVLADVLLVKKNGYDIATEFKSHAQLSSIPIVLIWSGFIAFDEQKFTTSRADAKLEKPFDAESLRTLVKSLVPKLQTNKILDFLEYQELPPLDTAPADKVSVDKPPLSPPPAVEISFNETPLFNWEEPIPLAQEPLPTLSQPAPPLSPPLSDWEHNDLNDIEPDDFQQVPLPGKSGYSKPMIHHQDSLRAPPPQTTNPNKSPYLSPFDIDVTDAQIATMGESNIDVSLVELDKPISQKTLQELDIKTLSNIIDPARLESLIREEVRGVLKEIAWKVIPDMAERIVKEELEQLLKEAQRIS